MTGIKTTYCSYLLRLWRDDQVDTGWRAMLESVVEPGRQHYFKDIESLMVYLTKPEGDELPDTKGE